MDSVKEINSLVTGHASSGQTTCSMINLEVLD